jgi:hypothetical protein
MWGPHGGKRADCNSGADVLGEEQGGAIQRLVGLVEHAGEGLEDVGHRGRDVEDHVHVGGPARAASRVESSSSTSLVPTWRSIGGNPVRSACVAGLSQG